MDFLKKLFGGGGGSEAKAAEPESYNGFAITPTPIKDGAEYRICATIEKDGQSHQMIRADTMRDPVACAEASVAKAKQVIDQQGDRIFR